MRDLKIFFLKFEVIALEFLNLKLMIELEQFHTYSCIFLSFTSSLC